MTRIHLVRHGESEWNILKKIQGHANAPLTTKGLKQAEQVAKKFKNMDIDVVYSSDLDRARITAETIASYSSVDLHVREDLREMNFGVWETMLFSEVQEKYPKQFEQWMKEPEYLNIDEGENLESLQFRMNRVLDDIIGVNEGKDILIVSHGTALKTMLLTLLDIPLTNYKNLAMDNVSHSIIEIRDYNNVLKLYNDTSHLGE